MLSILDEDRAGVLIYTLSLCVGALSSRLLFTGLPIGKNRPQGREQPGRLGGGVRLTRLPENVTRLKRRAHLPGGHSCAGPGYPYTRSLGPLAERSGSADEGNRLAREDLEAMRQEFEAGVWHSHGRPLELDDDLYQIRQIEWAGITLDEWAKARDVPLAYAKALRRFLQQG